MEFRLVIVAILALATFRGVSWLIARHDPNLVDHRIWDVALAATLAGVFVGRVAFVLTSGGNLLTSPADLVAVRAGVATGWASLAALLVVAIHVVRRSDPRLADALAVPVLAGLAMWQAGCLLHGSCAGVVTDVPWAISVSGSPIGRHPVELYAALLLAGAAALLRIWQRRHPRRPEVAASLALAAAGAARLATEPLRLSLGGGPVAWYLAAVVLGLGLAVVAMRVERPGSARTFAA